MNSLILLLIAIVIGALLGSHPAVALVAVGCGAWKLRQSESLLCCCTHPDWKRTKLIAFGRIYG